MRKRLTCVGLVGLFLILSVGGASAEVMRWLIDGATREAVVHVPDKAREEEGEGVPVVLAFHGYGDNVENFQHTRLHMAWREAIVVYFQGLPTRRGLPGWQSEPGAANRDLKLVDVALASLRETYHVDDDRVYATGYSNGGSFTYLLWAERPGVFAAYAPVAARLRSSVRPTQPRPLFHVAGETDRQVDFWEQEKAIAVAVEVNGVGATTARCGNGCNIYGADTAAPVKIWVHAGGHIYPRGTAERIMRFFREYRRD